MTKKKSASSLISELKRKTRRSYSSREKIRIIIEGTTLNYTKTHHTSVLYNLLFYLNNSILKVNHQHP